MPTIPKYDYVIIKLLAMGTTIDKPEMQSELKQWLFETENFLKKQSTKFLKPIKVNVQGVFHGIKVRNYIILQEKENIQNRQNKE